MRGDFIALHDVPVSAYVPHVTPFLKGSPLDRRSAGRSYGPPWGFEVFSVSAATEKCPVIAAIL